MKTLRCLTRLTPNAIAFAIGICSSPEPNLNISTVDQTVAQSASLLIAKAKMD